MGPFERPTRAIVRSTPYLDITKDNIEALSAERSDRRHSPSAVSGGDVSYRIRGSGLFVSHATLRDEPDPVKRFVRAYKQAFTIVNPDEAIAITSRPLTRAPPREFRWRKSIPGLRPQNIEVMVD
jgi:hypothetical protein